MIKPVVDGVRAPARRVPSTLPLALTAANLTLGTLAIVWVLDAASAAAAPARARALTAAAAAIFAAMLCDFFDGLVARATRCSSPLGKQLDSLADLVSFGVAPAVLTVGFASRFLDHAGTGRTPALNAAAITVAVAYVLCAAFRLARFLQDGTVVVVNPSGGGGRYFAGMPSTPAAGLLVAIVGVNGGGPLTTIPACLAYLAVVAALGLLMVSRWRYRHQSDLALLRLRSPLTLALAAVVLLGLVVAPRWCLLALAVAYAASGVVVRLLSALRHPQPAR